MAERRAAEDEQSAKQYDIVGIPKQATQEDNMNFVAYILGEIGLTKASVKSCDVQAMNNDTAGQEIWRLTFKDHTSKKSINEFFEAPKNGTWSFGEQTTKSGRDIGSGEDGPKEQ